MSRPVTRKLQHPLERYFDNDEASELNALLYMVWRIACKKGNYSTLKSRRSTEKANIDELCDALMRLIEMWKREGYFNERGRRGLHCPQLYLLAMYTSGIIRLFSFKCMYFEAEVIGYMIGISIPVYEDGVKIVPINVPGNTKKRSDDSTSKTPTPTMQLMDVDIHDLDEMSRGGDRWQENNNITLERLLAMDDIEFASRHKRYSMVEDDIPVRARDPLELEQLESVAGEARFNEVPGFLGTTGEGMEVVRSIDAENMLEPPEEPSHLELELLQAVLMNGIEDQNQRDAPLPLPDRRKKRDWWNKKTHFTVDELKDLFSSWGKNSNNQRCSYLDDDIFMQSDLLNQEEDDHLRNLRNGLYGLNITQKLKDHLLQNVDDEVLLRGIDIPNFLNPGQELISINQAAEHVNASGAPQNLSIFGIEVGRGQTTLDRYPIPHSSVLRHSEIGLSENIDVDVHMALADSVVQPTNILAAPLAGDLAQVPPDLVASPRSFTPVPLAPLAGSPPAVAPAVVAPSLEGVDPRPVGTPQALTTASPSALPPNVMQPVLDGPATPLLAVAEPIVAEPIVPFDDVQVTPRLRPRRTRRRNPPAGGPRVGAPLDVPANPTSPLQVNNVVLGQLNFPVIPEVEDIGPEYPNDFGGAQPGPGPTPPPLYEEEMNIRSKISILRRVRKMLRARELLRPDLTPSILFSELGPREKYVRKEIALLFNQLLGMLTRNLKNYIRMEMKGTDIEIFWALSEVDGNNDMEIGEIIDKVDFKRLNRETNSDTTELNRETNSDTTE